MSNDQQYLAALGVAMRTFLELNGDDPESVYATLSQYSDQTEFVSNLLDSALHTAITNDITDQWRIEELLSAVKELVDDILATFGDEKSVQKGVWIAHTIPVCPVDPDTLVTIRTREGDEGDGRANVWDWSFDELNPFDGDIIVYRVEEEI